MSTFYEIDSTRISLKEYWWWHKSPIVLIAWINKWLGAHMPISSDDPNTESTLPFVVDRLPPDVDLSFQPLPAEFKNLGFIDPVFHIIHDPGTRTIVYWATYRHESGKYFARIHRRVWQLAQKPNRALFPMFFTEFSDGTFLVSSAGKPDTDAPASIFVNRMPGAKCDVLWQKHLALTEQRLARNSARAVQSQADLIAATERHHVLARDFHLARGIFRPRSAEEQASANAYAETVARGQASGYPYPEIIGELNKLQESKPAWGGAIWILLISVILFVAAGVASWSWKFTLWLIPALLFHEGGHWAAMRIFNYRNLRMFFIPLFGAAVTGQNWNVAGWKKALVALAGPLPGIALGCIIGIAGVITRRAPLIEGALILVLLNGFNLIPILPLDGGRFMQAILFCRNRWLDVTFRVLTVAGLIGLTLLGLGRFLIYLAIPLAIYIPVAFKLGEITDSLRNANLPPPPSDQDRIPEQTAERIISDVKSALPKKLNNKAIAQHSLTVFESLNARPPGVLGTLGLVVLYGGGICMAILTGALFLVAKDGKLGDFVKAAVRQPHYSFSRGNVQVWHGSDVDSSNSSSRNLLVSSFKSVSIAESTFASLTNRLPATGRLTLFGQSLLLTLPSADDNAREQWFEELQNISTNTFVVLSNRPVMITMTCLAPTSEEATNLQHVLTDYLDVAPGLHLVPPWSPEANGAAFSKYENARKVWLRIDKELNAVWTNAEIKQLNSKIAAARKRGSMEEAKSLAGDLQDLANKLRQQAREKLKSNPDFDPELVELKGNLSDLEYTNTVERAAILHQVSLKLGATGDGQSNALDYGATSGFVQRHGLILEINWATMDNPSVGLPALGGWLCDKNCAGIHYEIFADLEESDD